MALILINKNGGCFCDCSDKCAIEHKSGMEKKCSKIEIENAGHRPIEVADEKSAKAVMDFITIDGINKKIKIKLTKGNL